MDKDEYFKILDDASCYNLENFFFDKEWASMGALSHIASEKEDGNGNISDTRNESTERFENTKIKKDKNAIKMIE